MVDDSLASEVLCPCQSAVNDMDIAEKKTVFRAHDEPCLFSVMPTSPPPMGPLLSFWLRLASCRSGSKRMHVRISQHNQPYSAGHLLLQFNKKQDTC